MKGNRTGKGYFSVKGKEKLSPIALGLRLPESVDTKLREEFGLSGAALLDYIREAVTEKIERDSQPTKKPPKRSKAVAARLAASADVSAASQENF